MDTISVHIISYGIATEIVGAKKKRISLPKSSTIEEAKIYLMEHYPRFRDLASLSFAIEEEYRNDDYVLSENEELIIIPPVSGG